MYAESIGQVRERFWKTFGQYMALVPGANGERINWVNYKTGAKEVRFVMELGDQQAMVAVIVTDPQIFNSKWFQLSKMFEEKAGSDWSWQPGRVSAILSGVDVRRSEDWPALISFFKERIMALDAFWNEVKDSF